MRILLVEDHALLAVGIRDALMDEGDAVEWVCDGLQALGALRVEPFDVMVLDLGLPRLSGLEVLKRLRQGDGVMEGNRELPVLILTARDQIPDRIGGLNAGADDYLVKPFDVGELIARLRALHRRSQGRSVNTLDLGPLRIQPEEHLVLLEGNPLPLSRREYALLLLLAEHAGKVLAKSHINDQIYGWGEELESNALEVHIHNLRRKLGGRFIRTVRGVGYCLDTSAAS